MKKILISAIISLCTLNICNSQTVFEWAKKVDLNNISYATGFCQMVVDAKGNSYTTGNFTGTVDFDPGPGVYNMTSNLNNRDIYIVKLNQSGVFIWAKKIGGSGDDRAFKLIINSYSELLLSAYTDAPIDVDPSSNTFMLFNNASTNVQNFIAKYNQDGGVMWANPIIDSNSGNSSMANVIFDKFNNVYITGNFGGFADFDPSTNVDLRTAVGRSIFIVKLNANGGFVFSKQIDRGNTNYETPILISSVPSGILLVTGYYGTIDFDPNGGIFNVTSGPNGSMAMIKITQNGDLLHIKQADGFITPSEMTTDNLDRIYITGSYSGLANFSPSGSTGITTTPTNYPNGFIAKYDTEANFYWAKTFNSTGFSGGQSITVDNNYNLITMGQFNSTTDFDPNSGVTNLTPVGSFNGYISMLDQNGNFKWVNHLAGSTMQLSVRYADHNIYTAGYFTGTIDFDAGTNTYPLTSTPNYGLFVNKINIPPTSPPGQTNLRTQQTTISENENHILSYYPNPTNKDLNITLSEQSLAHITIIDAAGMVMKETTTKDYTISIDIENLNEGIYFIQIIQNGNVYNEKIIKN